MGENFKIYIIKIKLWKKKHNVQMEIKTISKAIVKEIFLQRKKEVWIWWSTAHHVPRNHWDGQQGVVGNQDIFLMLKKQQSNDILKTKLSTKTIIPCQVIFLNNGTET